MSVDLGPEVPAECAAVGCGGCVDELLEYPCRCRYCRGLGDDRITISDGELTWWRCEFCGHYFDLDDMEILSGDGQACEPCVSGWERSLRERKKPEAGGRLDAHDDERPAPGAVSLP